VNVASPHARILSGPPLAGARENVNIAEHLPRNARRSPQRAAVIAPAGRRGWSTATYAELDERCDAIAHGLSERGLARGDRVALFVRPGLDLIAITFAVFKLGAVPVLIDPGMGRDSLIACLAKMKPRAFVGIPLAHVLRRIHAARLASIEIDVVVGPGLFPGVLTLAEIARGSRAAFPCTPTRSDETAAILFTSGSTGPPKGVVYTHGMFDAQVRAIRALYTIRADEVDLACFPLFALFDVALETTCVVPRLDATRPAACDPEQIAGAIETHGCTYTFGSPAIWERVAPWAVKRGVRFPTLERVLIAGAPVAPSLVATMRTLLASFGDVHTPYGATECLPVTSISGAEIEGDARELMESGFGTCVGRAAPGIDLALIDVHDRDMDAWSESLVLGAASIGEICVRGEVVTREYAGEPRFTRAAKIADGERVWHRTGDAGWIDERGRLWIVGRKAHRIEMRDGVAWPVPLENVYDLHPRVRRTALVGCGALGQQTPCLVVEPVPGSHPNNDAERTTFTRELGALRRSRERGDSPARLPEVSRVLFCDSLPVDVRHNAKIQREKLAVWAEEQGA
jgi:olefin beta-lactone synthetase